MGEDVETTLLLGRIQGGHTSGDRHGGKRSVSALKGAAQGNMSSEELDGDVVQADVLLKMYSGIGKVRERWFKPTRVKRPFTLATSCSARFRRSLLLLKFSTCNPKCLVMLKN